MPQCLTEEQMKQFLYLIGPENASAEPGYLYIADAVWAWIEPIARFCLVATGA